MMTGEREVQAGNGWGMLAGVLVGFVVLISLFVGSVVALNHRDGAGPGLGGIGLGVSIVGFFVNIVLSCGFFTITPNASAVLVMLGEYRGTVKQPGFYWANPFMRKVPLSLRVRNFNTEKLKVNDAKGNPIEIAAVVVWRVVDTFKVSFEVDNYGNYVDIQSEAAVRHLASSYAYDSHEGEKSLRGSMDDVSRTLMVDLQTRLDKAGIVVDEARLSHLAYAPEIAGAMLRRQQAEAVVAARMKIVEGAVGMVESALEHMAKSQRITLDEERKAAMVSNLMVVLCGDHSAQPVVNAGSLYS